MLEFLRNDLFQSTLFTGQLLLYFVMQRFGFDYHSDVCEIDHECITIYYSYNKIYVFVPGVSTPDCFGGLLFVCMSVCFKFIGGLVLEK